MSKLKSLCPECNKQTNHEILFSEKEEFENTDYDFWSHTIHSTIKCMGCESISYRRETYTSEDISPINGEVDSRIETYPLPDSNRKPIPGLQYLPDNLADIYLETLEAIKAETHILATVGLRACIEGIVNDKAISGRGLADKINNLQSQGYIAADNALVLHKIREVGNLAAHEITAGSKETIESAIDVIEILLRMIYVAPHARIS